MKPNDQIDAFLRKHVTMCVEGFLDWVRSEKRMLDVVTAELQQDADQPIKVVFLRECPAHPKRWQAVHLATGDILLEVDAPSQDQGWDDPREKLKAMDTYVQNHDPSLRWITRDTLEEDEPEDQDHAPPYSPSMPMTELSEWVLNHLEGIRPDAASPFTPESTAAYTGLPEADVRVAFEWQSRFRYNGHGAGCVKP